MTPTIASIKKLPSHIQLDTEVDVENSIFASIDIETILLEHKKKHETPTNKMNKTTTASPAFVTAKKVAKTSARSVV